MILFLVVDKKLQDLYKMLMDMSIVSKDRLHKYIIAWSKISWRNYQLKFNDQC